MNIQENACYQRMRRSMLRRYARGTWKKWPGEPSGVPAHTKYPNILAELDAMIWPNIELLAEFAAVSPEIVAAVMEDNEDLTFAELRGMARVLRCEPITYASWRWGCQYIRDELEYRRKTALKRRITRAERRTSA